jgi:hypothetical protein
VKHWSYQEDACTRRIGAIVYQMNAIEVGELQAMQAVVGQRQYLKTKAT